MRPDGLGYGRYGSETTRELQQLLCALDGAYGAMITSSGFSAISTALMGLVSAGDHVLMVDTVYEPTRHFGARTLKELGVETTFYSPDSGSEIEALIQANTRVIYLESPGSLTFEVQDLHTLIDIAKKHNIVSMLDNTWATSVNYPAITHGINIAIQSATKYIGGHSDLMMGVITTDEANWAPVRKSYIALGHSPGTEETMLALRGLRTLPCRLKQHGDSALRIAKWLSNHQAVKTVYFPALESSPYHALYQQHFSATSGLLSFTLKTTDLAAMTELTDNLNLFSIGESWAGYESLILPVNPSNIRTAKPWTESNPLIRLSIGLEHPDDLIADLKAGFERLAAHSVP